MAVYKPPNISSYKFKLFNNTTSDREPNQQSTNSIPPFSKYQIVISRFLQARIMV